MHNHARGMRVSGLDLGPAYPGATIGEIVGGATKRKGKPPLVVQDLPWDGSSLANGVIRRRVISLLRPPAGSSGATWAIRSSPTLAAFFAEGRAQHLEAAGQDVQVYGLSGLRSSAWLLEEIQEAMPRGSCPSEHARPTPVSAFWEVHAPIRSAAPLRQATSIGRGQGRGTTLHFGHTPLSFSSHGAEGGAPRQAGLPAMDAVLLRPPGTQIASVWL